MTPRPAQTNLQLFAELREAGWPKREIEAVGATYALARELLTAQYRANGKPFIDHFVGTASLVLAIGGRPALVRAALIHNAYHRGWTNGRPGATSRRRASVRAVVGNEAEDLVHDYHLFAWTDADVASLHGRVDELDDRERDLVTLRLANELEDRLDLGALHSRQGRRSIAPMAELADLVGEPMLADGLRAVAIDEATAEVEPGLVHPGHGTSFVAPRSYRRRLAPVTYDVYRAVRWRVGRVLRAIGLR